MPEKDTHLFYTLSDDDYTSRFSIDISNSERIFRNAIMSKTHRIRHMDLIPGNFVVTYAPLSMQLFKVISVNDNNFTIAHDNRELTVFYEKGDDLECVCPDLRTTFNYKLSRKDILRTIVNLKEGIDEYKKLAENLRPMGILNADWSEQPTEQKTGNLPVLIARRSKKMDSDVSTNASTISSLDLEGGPRRIDNPINVSSTKITNKRRSFIRRISNYIRGEDKDTGNEEYKDSMTIVRRLSEYIQGTKSVDLRQKSIFKTSPPLSEPEPERKQRKLHWVLRCMMCIW